MPIYPIIPTTSNYRLATGWITKAALEASSAYLLDNFTVQLDQHSALAIPWGPPEDTKTLYPARLRYWQNADQTQGSDGSFRFTWSLTYLTEMMVVYLENLIWPASVETAQVTVETLEHNGTFLVYQCYANKPQGPATHFARGYQGLEYYVINFVAGTRISV